MVNTLFRMETVFVVAALVLSLAACGASILLLLKRVDHADLASKVRALELETADLVDRLSVWQRRDAARQRRSVEGAAPVELGGPQPDQHAIGGTTKSELRAVARSRGLMR